MVVVHRAHGLRFVIYIDDHESAHIHACGDGEAKVQLVGEAGKPQILRVSGMTRADQRRMMREIADRQDMLLKRWEDIHG